MSTTNVGRTAPANQPQPVDAVSRPERIYIATPKTRYGTDRLQHAVRLLRARFPDAVLLLPWELYNDRADWLARFPAILEAMTQLIIVTDGEGYIGRGVAGECCAALQGGKPVHLLTDAGELIPHHRLRLSRADEKNWVRFQRVRVVPVGA